MEIRGCYSFYIYPCVTQNPSIYAVCGLCFAVTLFSTFVQLLYTQLYKSYNIKFLIKLILSVTTLQHIINGYIMRFFSHTLNF